MGLKTTNYQIPSMGIILPEAYAILDELKSEKNSVKAKFGVYASREASTTYHPIEVKQIYFIWDRQQDMAVQAYNETKTKQIEQIDPQTGMLVITTVPGIFSGWEDDIITE